MRARVALIAACVASAVGGAFGQSGKRADTIDDAAGAVSAPGGPNQSQERRDGNAAEATRAFLGLGAAPNGAAAARGTPIYAQNCAGCHGQDARGGIGPNLLYSTQVLDDDHSEKLVAFLKVGRTDKGMPAFAQESDRTLTDVAEYLHLQVEKYANRGTYQNTNNIMTGSAAAGAAFFKQNCITCHSADRDLKGVGARMRPLDLQHAMIFPPREDHAERAMRATVSWRGTTTEGIVTKIDDFEIVVTDKNGEVHPFRRGPDVAVALHDPLEWHKAFAYRVNDKQMTDLVTFLGALK